jgi:hypothetical protein
MDIIPAHWVARSRQRWRVEVVVVVVACATADPSISGTPTSTFARQLGSRRLDDECTPDH